ncbi:MAG: NAD(P)-dependent oxidoreductase [Planctomycetota bacterium]
MAQTVLVAEGSAPAPLAWLAERCRVLEVRKDDPTFASALAEADGLIVRSYLPVDDALLDGGPNLKVVGRGGVGIEHIDVAACRARGIEVVYTPDANTRAVAELVAGLMVKLVRPWHAFTSFPTADQFTAYRKDAGEHLHELTLGILGMGRVGHAVSRVAHHGFGMRVLYHDVADVDALIDVPAESVSHEQLVSRCDLLTVHVDGRPDNRGLVAEEELSRNVRWLINTSRGMCVDADAVHAALADDRLEGVALDVYDPEPPAADSAYAHILRDFPDRAILTPHMASRTKTAVQNMSWVVRDVWRVLSGEPPEAPAPTATPT